MSEKVNLKYAVELIEGHGLRLSYEVKNASQRAIYLTTPLVEVGDEAVSPSDDKLYSYFDPEGILHLTKRLWPVPDDADIYLPEVPWLTEVRAGATFEEQLTCAVPVDVRYPYRGAGEPEPAAPGEAVTVEAYGVAFSIGYLADSEKAPLRKKPAPEGAKGGHFVVSYAAAVTGQKLLQGAVVPVRVMVRDVSV